MIIPRVWKLESAMKGLQESRFPEQVGGRTKIIGCRCSIHFNSFCCKNHYVLQSWEWSIINNTFQDKSRGRRFTRSIMASSQGGQGAMVTKSCTTLDGWHKLRLKRIYNNSSILLRNHLQLATSESPCIISARIKTIWGWFPLRRSIIAVTAHWGHCNPKQSSQLRLKNHRYSGWKKSCTCW